MTQGNMRIVARRLTWLYDGSETRRFHGRRMINPPTVGEHSFRMILIILILERYDLLPHIDSAARLMRYAALHDIAEHVVGDIPAPTKRYLGMSTHNYEELLTYQKGGLTLPDLKEEEKPILRFVDCLDGIMTCIREAELGNGTLWDVVDVYNGYIEKLELPEGIKQLWMQLRQPHLGGL